MSSSSIGVSTLEARGLGKAYRNYTRPLDWLLEGFRKTPSENQQWALRDVTFDLAPGESLGIVGANGAGKSTLLQLVAGTLTPSAGEVVRRGRIAALLELGAGFNPEFTGRENARLNALLMGMSYSEIEEKMDEIIEFSGLGAAIDRAVKTYSSGMFVRLAFSVATASQPDILIIDEALSVGDGAFARKSFDRIMEIREGGATVLFCSHALYQIERLCERSIWIERGRILMDGPSRQVINAYQAKLDGEAIGNRATQQSHGVGENDVAGIPRLTVLSASVDGAVVDGARLHCISGKSEIRLQIEANVPEGVNLPNVAISITHASGVVVFGTGNWLGGEAMPLHSVGGNRYAIQFVLPKLALLAGSYRIDVAVTCERGVHFYDTAAGVFLLDVTQADETQGIVQLGHLWERPKTVPYGS